jgi:hypothetical protein
MCFVKISYFGTRNTSGSPSKQTETRNTMLGMDWERFPKFVNYFRPFSPRGALTPPAARLFDLTNAATEFTNPVQYCKVVAIDSIMTVADGSSACFKLCSIVSPMSLSGLATDFVDTSTMLRNSSPRRCTSSSFLTAGSSVCHMCLPAEGTTLGGAQAPTHSFPLRLAPAGTYWWATPKTAKTEPPQTPTRADQTTTHKTHNNHKNNNN